MGRPKGTKQPADAVARSAAACAQRWRDPAYRAHMRTTHTGREHSPETRAKISAAKRFVPSQATPEGRLYRKLRDALGVATARAELGVRP